MQVLLILLALVLVIYSISLVITSNFNMGNLLVWILTAIMTVYAIWQKPIHTWLHETGSGRFVFWILAVISAAYAALLVFVAVSGYTNTATGKEKAVVVLGAGLHRDQPSLLLRYRLNKALDYAQDHPDVLVITAGGQGRDEWVPEGQAMRDYLIAAGLEPERVLAECKSTSTEENFLFAKELLLEHGIKEEDPIVYVTNAFHCYRAGKYAQMAGFTSTHALPAGIPLRSVLPCYLREVLAVVYYWVFRSSRSGFLHPLVGLLSLNKKFFYQ
ncbi:MAG: YdcF family protein [Gemmiger sp.]